MKSLTQHLNEKLIINKNYKNIDGLEELFDNINFKCYDKYELKTSDDIFSIMVNYIRDHNIRSFSDFDTYSETSREGRHPCIAVFNKRIKEIDIFQNISNETYEVFIIFKHHSDYQFEKVKRRITSMHVLNKSNTWNNENDVEYYEISKETFDNVSELYIELFKK